MSFFSNLFRGALSFASGLLIARGLGPEKYGDFIFLLGSFMALRQVLDMGTSNAFYTFLSQKPRGIEFVKAYVLWQVFQLCVPLAAVSFLFSDSMNNLIWLGHDRALIVIALVAVFLREQAWNTMVQIGESARLTHRVQISNFVIAGVHFLIVVGTWLLDILSVRFLFALIVLEYLIAIVVAMRVFGMDRFEDLPIDWNSMFGEYRSFCAPLILLTLMGFVYEFADRWLLQYFGGAREQGFYGVSYQFSVIILLATTSLFQIIWKEIAEAQENRNLERVRFLYKKASRFLFTVGALMCGLLLPCAEVFVRVLLSESYIESAGILAIMLLNPVYQSLGHITGILLMTTGQMGSTLFLRYVIMACSFPCTYFLLAPSDAWLPGLNMGSLGVALKVIIVQIVTVNFIIWRIDRDNGWRFDWGYQIAGLGVSIPLGIVAFELSGELSKVFGLGQLHHIGLHVAVYGVLAGLFLWTFPMLAGLTQDEIRAQIMKLFIWLK